MKTLNVAAAALVLCSAAGVSAQSQVPDSVHLRDNCRLARQVLEQGQPANKRDWAIQYAPVCGGEGARALAKVIAARSGEQVFNKDLDLLVSSASRVIDRSLFEAGLALASNPGAGEASRIEGIRPVMLQIRTAQLDSYQSFLPGHDDMVPVATHRVISAGEALPADAAARAEAVARAIADDSSLSPPLRSAGRRLAGAMQVDLQCRGLSTQECLVRIMQKPD